MGLTITSQGGFNEITGTGSVGNPYNLDNTAADNLFFNASTDVAGTIYYSYYGTAYNNGTHELTLGLGLGKNAIKGKTLHW